MAGVRIQRQTRRSNPHASSDRAVSSTTRLADVVRGNDVLSPASLVCSSHRQTSAGRQTDPGAAQEESVLQSASALYKSIAVPIPVLGAGHKKENWPMVGSRAARFVFLTHVAAEPGATDALATNELGVRQLSALSTQLSAKAVEWRQGNRVRSIRIRRLQIPDASFIWRNSSRFRHNLTVIETHIRSLRIQAMRFHPCGVRFVHLDNNYQPRQ